VFGSDCDLVGHVFCSKDIAILERFKSNCLRAPRNRVQVAV
jgi:hypothetical protein